MAIACCLALLYEVHHCGRDSSAILSEDVNTVDRSEAYKDRLNLQAIADLLLIDFSVFVKKWVFKCLRTK